MARYARSTRPPQRCAITFSNHHRPRHEELAAVRDTAMSTKLSPPYKTLWFPAAFKMNGAGCS
jgi:hypothetical protein